MIALMLAAILSQTGPAEGPGHVLTGTSPGEGEARWMVGARVVSTNHLALPLLTAARHKGWSERTSWLMELEASPRWVSAATGYGVDLLPSGSPLTMNLRLSGGLYLTRPSSFTVAAGSWLTWTTAWRWAGSGSAPTLGLRLRYGGFVGASPRFPQGLAEGRAGLVWEQRLSGRLGLLAEAAIHAPVLGGVHRLSRPTATVGLSF